MPICVAALPLSSRPPVGIFWHKIRDGTYQDSVSFLSQNRHMTLYIFFFMLLMRLVTVASDILSLCCISMIE